MGRLQGKYILITRTSQGLGKQLALNYAREGAAGIAIVARNESDLKDVSDRPFFSCGSRANVRTV